MDSVMSKNDLLKHFSDEGSQRYGIVQARGARYVILSAPMRMLMLPRSVVFCVCQPSPGRHIHRNAAAQP